MAIIDVVKFDGLRSRDWIVYKHYAEDLSTATQLIVAEGQVAALLKGGRICDVFGPGRYTLATENLPILRELIKLPFGGRTPFTAEIFYINTVSKLDLTWGTSDPISLIDPRFNIRLRIRAFGQVGIKITNYVIFLRELIGSLNGAEVVDYEKVLEFYKGILITKVKSVIAKIIINDRISALDISAQLSDISDKVAQMLERDFERFGVRLINFYIKSINFPDEDFEKINSILTDRAAFDIMGDTRYATKRSFDIYEGAANNENGVAGAFAAGGLGFGAGAAMYNGAMGAGAAMNTPKPAENKRVCAKCGAENPANAMFCNSCGNKLQQPNMICPKCSAENPPNSRFCSSCGQKLGGSVCECGAELALGAAFCSNCGRKVGE